MTRFSKADEFFMKRAFVLAEKTTHRKHAEPKVGAVFVHGAHIVGEGYFNPRSSKKHAEIKAFESIPYDAPKKDLTLYLTMEPCTVYKRTGSCTDHLLLNHDAIKRVVIADKNYHPEVNGFSMHLLRMHGFKVDFGLFQRKAQIMNKKFNDWSRKQKYEKPHVLISVATTADGKIADMNPKTEDVISTRKDAKAKDRLRAEVGAVIVGGNTFSQDDPSLIVKNYRMRQRVMKEKGYASPIKVVVSHKIDRTLKLNSEFFNEKKTGPVRKIFFTTQKTTKQTIDKIKKQSPLNDVFVFSGKEIDLREVLKTLSFFGVQHVLVEGGGTINFAFAQAKLIDEVQFHVRSMLIGGKDAITSFEGDGFELKDAQKINLKAVDELDSETVILRYEVNYKKV
jgi:diaminohydroxyphosphoribosylaminopyrimidine deaminase/5-amino-6-(5-phosphoribosylamino)uracil reductase